MIVIPSSLVVINPSHARKHISLCLRAIIDLLFYNDMTRGCLGLAEAISCAVDRFIKRGMITTRMLVPCR